jgi:hypothetical protein
MYHAIAWMVEGEDGLQPRQIRLLMSLVPDDHELFAGEASENNSTAHFFMDGTVLHELNIEVEDARKVIISFLEPILEDWELESANGEYVTPQGIRIFMACDLQTEHGNGHHTGGTLSSIVPEKLDTYRDLRTGLDAMTSEELDNHLTLHDKEDDEFYQISLALEKTTETDVLDEGHPYLKLSYIGVCDNG